MPFDAATFSQALQDKLGQSKPVNQNWNWLQAGSSGYSLGDVVQNFDSLDPQTQKLLLQQDVGGGGGGVIQGLISAYKNGVDPNLIQQNVSLATSGNVPQALQNLNQQNAQQSQLNSQNQQLSAFNKQYQGQMFGTDAQGNPLSMTDALTNNSGTIGALNKFETQQTSDTFNKLLQPEIQMALGGQGLQDSGASVELNSKALAQLQLAQQQNIMQAALGAQSQEQGLMQSQVLGNIAGQQGLVSNTLNTNNAYMTMQFQSQLMKQQAELAQQLTQYGGGGSGGIMGGLSGALGGGMAGMALGGPIGAGIGAIGGGLAGGLSSPGVGSGIGSLGSSFFAMNQPKYTNSTLGTMSGI